MRNVGVRQVEQILRVEAVAFFGDGERHQPGLARRQACEGRFGVGRADQQLANRANDARTRRGAELDQCVQPLLILERVTQSGALE